MSPDGSQDPFYVLIDKHYGASDHVVYMSNGIPSVMFITWPDMYYHSSQDTPDKLDPTQFKRAGVVGLGAMAVLAMADEPMATKVAAETLARGTERIGQAQRKGMAYLADATDGGVARRGLQGGAERHPPPGGDREGGAAVGRGAVPRTRPRRRSSWPRSSRQSTSARPRCRRRSAAFYKLARLAWKLTGAEPRRRAPSNRRPRGRRSSRWRAPPAAGAEARAGSAARPDGGAP